MKAGTKPNAFGAPILAQAASGLARSRAIPGPFLVILLLVLLVQGTAVQTHLHFAQQARVLAAGASVERPDHVSSPGDNDPTAECQVCQEAALAGAYVLSPPPAVPAPPAAVPWTATAAIAAFALASPALGWRSRAPPR